MTRIASDARTVARGSGPRYRLGVDIGGTFTDATLIDERSGDMHIAKVLSTTEQLSRGFVSSVEKILRDGRVAPSSVTYLVHATTVATNAIIEGKIARTAFVTSHGFRDMLEIARQMRSSLYDLRFVKPPPLVPRHLCFGVRERLDAHGSVLIPLDESDVHRIASEIEEAEVEAVAVCLLHAYVNSEHEEQVGNILRERLPGVAISLSSSVSPEIREYFRATTTIINASLGPLVGRYLTELESRLTELSLNAELFVMQSSGGVYRSMAARAKPVFMVESGPAAGVTAASFIGQSLGYEDVLSFDMGGTTAKVGLVLGGEPRITKEYEVGASARATEGEGRGAGYPIRTPVIDLVEIGAGGGSIAWIDSGGALRVGPESAGATPGPACYGLGGLRPTVTDANLVLGRLNPDYFLGGDMKLDRDAAYAAIERECAGPLAMSPVEAALSIVEIANAAMVNAIRLVSIQRGYDPRTLALIAFGGAGPAHANQLAAENEIATVIVPPSPGIASSMGLLVTDLKHDYTQSFARRLDDVAARELDEAFAALEREGLVELGKANIAEEAMHFPRAIEMRYIGQSHELTLPFEGPDAGDDSRRLAELADRFHDEHAMAYGFNAPDEPVEVVAVRLTAVGRIEKPKLRATGAAERRADPREAQKADRLVHFAEFPNGQQCPVYDRYRLPPDLVIEGPAVVEEVDATTLIHPGYRASTTDEGFLIITQASESAQRSPDGSTRSKRVAAGVVAR